MAMIDYGAILKVNGELKNINQGLFMDMKDAVGFTIDTIPFQYQWGSKTYSDKYAIDGYFFVYFGDEEMLFCVYKNLLRVVVNKKEVYDFYLEDGRIVEHFQFNGANIKIKRIHRSKKLHAKIQYKGSKYDVIYGYGIDTSVKKFKEISRKQLYEYNKKITKYIGNFLNTK